MAGGVYNPLSDGMKKIGIPTHRGGDENRLGTQEIPPPATTTEDAVAERPPRGNYGTEGGTSGENFQGLPPLPGKEWLERRD